MYSENSTTLMSSDLQLADSGNEGVNGQISQIPGLSPTIKTLNDARARGRRTGVLDSDSDYVKLAKQGGHKGLLWHEEALATKSEAYKAPNWFCSELDSSGGGASQPSVMSSEERRASRTAPRREPPFGTDNMSAWQRDESGAGPHKNNSSQQAVPMEKWQSSPVAQHSSRFKRTAFDKRPAPVDMSKLLSFGYADDNKPTAGNFASK